MNKQLLYSFLLCICEVYSVFHDPQQCGKYQHVLDDGQVVECDECLPGQYLEEHCTLTQPTKCVTCPSHQFNNACGHPTKCRDCSMVCETPLGLEMMQPCTPEADLQCGCGEGKFRSPAKHSPCIPHSPCGVGYGAEKGNRTTNTTCGICPNGTFSNLSENLDQPCQPWSTCGDGLEIDRLGNATYDTRCKEGSNHTGEVPPSTNHTGLIIGVCVSAVVVVAVGVILYCVKMRRRKTPRTSSSNDNGEDVHLAEVEQNRDILRNGMGDFDDAKDLQTPPPLTDNGEGDVFEVCARYISQHIFAKKWKFFLRELPGIDDTIIDRLQIDYGIYGVEEWLYKGITKFKELNPDNATATCLIQAGLCQGDLNKQDAANLEYLAKELHVDQQLLDADC